MSPSFVAGVMVRTISMNRERRGRHPIEKKRGCKSPVGGFSANSLAGRKMPGTGGHAEEELVFSI